MRGRAYKDEIRAGVMAAVLADATVSEIAKAYGISERTVQRIKNQEMASVVTRKKQSLDDLFEAEVRSALEIASTKRDTAKYSELVMAAAVSTDKMRLLREMSTSISETRPATREEKEERVKQLAEKHGLRLIDAA